MGNDAALAVLSEKPRQVFNYFKQLFAQVTNPPIDPIREEIVMSLVCPVGPEENLLSDPSPAHCKRLIVRHPVLTLEEMNTLKNSVIMREDGSSAFKTAVIYTTFPVGSGPDGMLQVSLERIKTVIDFPCPSHLCFSCLQALERICDEAADAIQGELGSPGVEGAILSDKFAGPDRIPLASLLAVGAVHQHLLKTKQRPKAAVFAEAGDAKEVCDYATLFGYGADGVCPYMAYEVICKMNADGQVEAKLFSATGFTGGAKQLGESRGFGLFDIDAMGDVHPHTTFARSLVPSEPLEPAFLHTPRPEDKEPDIPINPFGPVDDSDAHHWVDCPRCGVSQHHAVEVCVSCGADVSSHGRMSGSSVAGSGNSGIQTPGSTNTPAPPVARAPASGGPRLRCRTCGSHDIELHHDG